MAIQPQYYTETAARSDSMHAYEDGTDGPFSSTTVIASDKVRCPRASETRVYKAKLWNAFDYVQTWGKGYLITEGDGLAHCQECTIRLNRSIVGPIASSSFPPPAEKCQFRY